MGLNETSMIGCEIKISITSTSWLEVQELIVKINEACQSDYKLEIKMDGDFLKAKPPKEVTALS